MNPKNTELAVRAQLSVTKMGRLVAKLKSSHTNTPPIRTFNNRQVNSKQEIYAFDLGAETDISIIKNGSICYAEIRKMSDPSLAEHDMRTILFKMDILGMKAIDKSDFLKLCQKISL